MNLTITEEQKQHLDREGYFLLEDVFTQSDMEALARNIEALNSRNEERLRAEGSKEGSNSRAGEITFTSHLAQQDEAICDFCKRPEFVAITTQLLGPDIDLYWNQSVFKHPEGRKEFPWHQDDAYAEVTPAPYLTLWLALNDATPENGCISVMPGSHRHGIVPHQATDIGKVCHSNDDPDQGTLVPLKSGSMAVFWSQTFHKSGPNLSNRTRKAFVIQYSQSPLRYAMTNELVGHVLPIARGGVAV